MKMTINFKFVPLEQRETLFEYCQKYCLEHIEEFLELRFYLPFPDCWHDSSGRYLAPSIDKEHLQEPTMEVEFINTFDGIRFVKSMPVDVGLEEYWICDSSVKEWK